MPYKILFVLTSHAKVEGTGEETGWFLPELAHPYYKLAPHAEVVIASPAGGKAPLSQYSIQTSQDEESQRFLKESAALWENTQRLETFKGRAEDFHAIFFVGGGGPVFDIADSAVSHELIREFYEASKVVSAVCHGVAALAKVKLSDGSYLVAGQKVTGFSNKEEEDTGLWNVLPFFLETELRENVGKDGKYEKADTPWEAKVIVSGKDGGLITGQNPASASLIGEAIWAAISKS